MSRLLIIGLDGATLDLVEPWAKSGKLPVIANMMNNGSYARLRSVLPVLSSAAWISFMTGLNPGKHGFYDFVRREENSYRLRLLRRDHLKVPTLWQLLNHQDRKVGVINVPMTYPPEKVNGFLISGLGTPDFSLFTYPENLGPMLMDRGYRVNKSVAFQPGNEDEFLKETYETSEQITDTALWLMDKYEWDFSIVVYRDTDELAHYFWKHMDSSHPLHNIETDVDYSDAILNYYQKLDSMIGQFLDKVGPETNIMILSDHGGGPLYKDVFLNEWLRQKGLLTTKHTEVELRGVKRKLANIGITRTNVSSTLRNLGMTRIERWLKNILGDRIEVLPRTKRAEFPDAIDWSNTLAYSFGYHGQIYINLKGREPQGIVNPGTEYNLLIKDIKDNLLNMTDPLDEKPVVDQVFLKEEIYNGPYIDFAPDLTVIMRDLSYITRQGYEFGEHHGEIFATPATNESGSHRLNGLLIATGPDIKSKGLRMEDAELIDIAPTVLHILNCPVPEYMDGKVLRDWCTTTHQVNIDHPQDYQSELIQIDWSEDEEQKMIERLKQLGYLE